MRKHTYDQFYQGVRESLKERLSCYKITDEQLDKYLEEEEKQVRGGFKSYTEKDQSDPRTDDVIFNSQVNATAVCLEYCY